ncbi:MAG: hypothetical protein J6E42_04275 [Firmicutes bacterium]|nr:hypothetical protein [Bacillota bacterium]
MVRQDTIELLKECDAGVKMAVTGIDDVLGDVHSNELKGYLVESRERHKHMGNEIHRCLKQYHEEGKEPGTMARGMSWLKTNAKLAVDDSDSMIAELMTDGCDMGVKSLNRYLNEYEQADEASRDIAKRLIRLEENLAQDIRGFL